MVMEVLVTAVSEAFIKHEQQLLRGELVGDLIDYCSPPVREVVRNAKEVARKRIFKDYRKLTVEIGSYSTLGILLEATLSAVRERVLDGAATFRNQRVLRSEERRVGKECR